jgi:hypothetical protein
VSVFCANDWVQLLELQNKVCDLGFSLRVVVWAVRMNCCGGFGFGGGAVLVGSSGDPVSFNTTVLGGVVVLLKDKLESESHHSLVVSQH